MILALIRIIKMLIAIDQGTSSSRVIAFSHAGQKVMTKQYPLTLSYPNPGWVELDPQAMWQTTARALREILLEYRDPVAIGITNQRETTILWDKLTGAPIKSAIVWQDRRTQAYCETLKDRTAWFYEKTGLIPDAYFSATKIKWLLDNTDGLRERARKGEVLFGTVDSYLLWHLTQGQSHKTDVTNASRTLIFNIHTLAWDEDLLKFFDIPREMLPEVMPTDAHFGTLQGFGADIPITGMIGDQQGALVGQGCVSEGLVKATYGTGGFVMINTGSEVPVTFNGLIATVAYTIQGQTAYALEGSIYQAGSMIKWLRDVLHVLPDAASSETLASSFDSNGGVYLIPSFTGLGAPFWRDETGAQLLGLTLQSTPAHIVRAVLESVAYQTNAILDVMRLSASVSSLRVDGGMANNDWLLGLIEALSDVSIEKSKELELTAKGAAIVAGIGVGLYSDLSVCERLWVKDEVRRKYQYRDVDYGYTHWNSMIKKTPFSR